jgi:hypothetical protein
METADRIYKEVKALPEPLRREVLEFVEHLALKLRAEDVDWSELSLRAALRGLENEPGPEYGEGDFKEKWK